MKQYKVLQSEYKTDKIQSSSIETELNDLAKQGWSVVSSSSFFNAHPGTYPNEYSGYYVMTIILEK